MNGRYFIVSFCRKKTNQGVTRLFRYVKDIDTEREARKSFEDYKKRKVCLYAFLIHKASFTVLDEVGDESIEDEWCSLKTTLPYDPTKKIERFKECLKKLSSKKNLGKDSF